MWKNQVDITKLVPILCKKGIKKILLEGGGTLNLSFLKNNLIDELIITVSPFVLGSKESVNLFEGILKSTKKLSTFKLKSVQKITNEPMNNVHASLVHRASENSINAVMIGGKIVNGKL